MEYPTNPKKISAVEFEAMKPAIGTKVIGYVGTCEYRLTVVPFPSVGGLGVSYREAKSPFTHRWQDQGSVVGPYPFSTFIFGVSSRRKIGVFK